MATGIPSKMSTPVWRIAATTEVTPDACSDEQDTREKIKTTSKAGFLAPCRQIPVAWACLLLTTALFVLTTLFANNSAILMNVRAVSTSISRPISMLRLLSGVMDALLFASCSAAFERLQWVLVSRRKGISAAGFVSLSASTGLMGLLVLALGSSGKDKTARMFALMRLLAIVLCPALGIILMSDVSTQRSNYVLAKFDAPYGTGMSLFDGSLAPLAALEVDRMFGHTMTAFLKSGEIAVDITDPELRPMSCAQGPSLGRTPTCQRKVFMPGPVPGEFVLRNGVPDADISMAYDLQGCILDFGKGDEKATWQFSESECEVIGMSFGAVRLCIHNTEVNAIQARMIKCPSRVAAARKCLSDTSWHKNLTSTVTTSLHTTFQWADVAYHRPNGSIAWHTLRDKQENAPIPATEILYAYKSFAQGAASFTNLVMQWMQDHPELMASTDTGTAGTTSGPEDSSDIEALSALQDLSGILDSLSNTPIVTNRRSSADGTASTDRLLSSLSSILGQVGISSSLVGTEIPGGNPVFPLIPYAMLTAVDVMAAKNPAMAIVATDYLQNFLAIPLFWCQSLLTVRGTAQGMGGVDIGEIFGSTEGGTDELFEAVKTLIGVDEATLQRLRRQTEPSKLAFSRLGYEIRIGRLSLLVFVALTTLILAASFVALMIGSTSVWAGYVPPTGPFALYDNMAQLVVLVDGEMLREEDWDMSRSVTSTGRQLEEMLTARVYLKQRVNGLRENM